MIERKGILIKNIFYMLSYAYQVLRQSHYEDIAAEEFQNIHDLFAGILAAGLTQQLKQGLYREYIPQIDDLPVLRGKLDMQRTIRHKLQQKTLLACEYDQLTENNAFNQILKATAEILLHAGNVKEERRQALKRVLLFFHDIDPIEPFSINWSTLTFHRHNRSYEMLLNICYFVISGLLLTTEKGRYKMAAFLKDINMARLFEKFVLEYYRCHHPQLHPAPRQVQWDTDEESVRFLPKNFTMEQYRIAWEWMNYPRTFLNSLGLTLTVSILQLASSTLVGYGFGRYNFRGKNLCFALVLLTLVVPPEMIMIPLFLNFRFFNLFGLIKEPGINLLGSYWPFILTSMTAMGLKNGLFIYIMTNFFKGMPDSLEEAAMIDGASSFRTFFQIMLPGAKPALTIVFLFSFVWQWNDLFYTNLFIRTGDGFLSLALQNFANYFVSNSPVSGNYPWQYTSLLNNAGMMLFMAPLLILFLIMQRHFVESIERTGLVG